ncbi:MAG: hypothetical protein K940chlam9_01764, partial [Chlamydiae bacterium]|nr:hypothetical protein [Chlamydiota bacterium]
MRTFRSYKINSTTETTENTERIYLGCNPNRLKVQVPILRHKVGGVLTHPSENNEYTNFLLTRHK